MTLPALIRRMSTDPARLIGLPRGSLIPGAAADITIIDTEHPFTVNRADFVSKGKNTPFDGMRLFGRPRFTMRDGVLTWSDVLAGLKSRRERTFI
jgi:dihydroorotase